MKSSASVIQASCTKCCSFVIKERRWTIQWLIVSQCILKLARLIFNFRLLATIQIWCILVCRTIVCTLCSSFLDSFCSWFMKLLKYVGFYMYRFEYLLLKHWCDAINIMKICLVKVFFFPCNCLEKMCLMKLYFIFFIVA